MVVAQRLLSEGGSAQAIGADGPLPAGGREEGRDHDGGPRRKVAKPSAADGHEETIIRLWHEGVSAGAIGRQIGLTKNAVLRARVRLGLPGRTTPIVHKDAWTAEEDRILIELCGEGYSASKIQAYMPHRSRNSINIHAKRMGLKRDRPTVTITGIRAPSRPLRPIFDPNGVYDDPVTDRPCQFIAGEPTRHDDCKCGKPTKVGKPYCPGHFYLCTRHDTGPDPNHVVHRTSILSTRFA